MRFAISLFLAWFWASAVLAQGSPIIQAPITAGHCAIWTSTYKIGATTSGCNTGTVTGITAGTGLLGGVITTSGTISLDTTRVFTSSLTGLAPASGGGVLKYLRADGSWQTAVTGVTAGVGLTGGTISTTGTLALDTTYVFGAINNGLAPASAGGTVNFLRADGTWAPAPGTGVSSFSAGTTGLTPAVPTTGAVVLAGTLAVANGGTGSPTQNFVDLTTAQASIAGVKTFTTQVIGHGTATNDSAATGYIGEYLSATGSGVALTTATTTDIASVPLAAGDYDACANVSFAAGAGDTPTSLAAWISTTTATDPGPPNAGAYVLEAATITIATTNVLNVGCQRISLPAAGTAYLSVKASHVGGTLTGGGFIGVRRPR